MKVYNYREVKAEKPEGGEKIKIRWLITKETGAENFAMRLFEVEPGGFSPLHSHPWEHEIFVLEGEGIVLGGGEKKPIGEGDVIFIPPNETHQLRNTGRKVMKFLCLIPYKQ